MTDEPDLSQMTHHERLSYAKALKDNWIVDPKTKASLIKQLTAIARSRRAGPRERIRAIEAIVAASKFEAEHVGAEEAITEITVKVEVLPGGMNQHELDVANKTVVAPSEPSQL